MPPAAPRSRSRASLTSTRRDTPAVEPVTDVELQSMSSSQADEALMAQAAGEPTSTDASMLLVQTLASMQSMLERQMRQQQDSIRQQQEAIQAQNRLITRLLDNDRRHSQPETATGTHGTQVHQQRTAQQQQRRPPHLQPYDSDAEYVQFEQQGHDQVAPQPVYCKPTVKPDDLGLFDGSPDRLEFFRSRIDALIQSRSDPGWEQAVIETLPLCLRDSAAQWYQLMGSTQRANLSVGWNAWEAALMQAFRPDDGEARRLADSRKWHVKTETVQQYFYSKLSLLRSAYPFRDEKDLAQEIRLGLPDTMRVLVRSHLNASVNPTKMLVELKSLEESWRSATGNAMRSTNLSSQAQTTADNDNAKSQNLFAQPKSAQASRASPKPQAGGLSMSADYRPENISFVERDGRKVRAYRLPQSGRTIYLGRSCQKCGQAHFDFEHDHMAASVKKEAHHHYAQAELELVEAYGYPMFNTEPIIVSDDDETSPTPELSFTSSGDSSTAYDNSMNLDNSTGSGENQTAIVLLIDPDLRTLSVEDKRRRTNPEAIDVDMPCAPATSSGRAFAGHLPTTAFVSVAGAKPRLSLVDTGSTLSIIDEELANKWHLKPLNGPGVEINGIGHDHSSGFATLSFGIQGRRDDKPIRLCSSADFHVVRNFAPGLCLGLDVVHSSGMVIDVQAGRAWVQNVSFPVYDTRGNPLTPKRINKAVTTTKDTIIPPRSHAWVPVCHSISNNVQYTLHNAAWLSSDSHACLALPTAVIDQHTGQVLVTNLADQPYTFSAGSPLGEAAPLGPDNLSTGTGSFLMQVKNNDGDSPHAAPAFLAQSSDDTSAQPLDFTDDDLARPRPPSSATAKVDDTFEVGLDDTGQPHTAIVEVLRRHVNAFSLDGKPGRVTGTAMNIPLRAGDTLKPEAPRRVSPEKRQVIEDTLDQLADWDVIEPSTSSVSYPVLLVRQGQKWRFCVDYRGLNAATIPDRYPLPRIDDVFEALAGNRYFSGLDAIRGYHQINIAPEDRWKTAFVCHKGLFQYKHIPFGLTNAPSFFQRFMDRLLGSMRWTEALVYLDDVVIFSQTLDQHARSLEKLLSAATSVGLRFSPKKCHFAISSLDLLGRHVSTDGISVLQDRVTAVTAIAPPQTLQQLYHVLGLFNYYRDFIPGYAIKAAPLTALLKGHRYKKFGDKWYLVDNNDLKTSASQVKLAWSAEHDEALNSLKAALTTPPTLAYPDYSRPFYLYIDASGQAFAAALHQRLPPPRLVTTQCLTASPQDDTLDRQRKDPLLKNVIATLEKGETRAGYELQDKALVYVGPKRMMRQFCVPASELKELFEKHHDKVHFGFAKTHESLRQYHHPRLAAQLQAYIDNCPTCLRTKLDRRTGKYSTERTVEASYPFHTISMDVILGLPECEGYDAALVVMDLFSRMLVTRACTSRATAADLYKMLTEMVLQRGFTPKVIVLDSDARFIGQVGKRFAESIGAELQPSAPYHQQANPVERHIQTLNRVLRALALDHPEDWPTYLPAAELAINQTPSVATGEAPFDLVYITKVKPSVLPSVSLQSHDDRLAVAKARIETAWQKALNSASKDKRTYNRRHNPLPRLTVGDKVFVRLKDRPMPSTARFPKLDPSKLGPFEVSEILSKHRIRPSLPPDLDTDPIFDTSQVDLAPSASDPFGRPLLATPDLSNASSAEEPEFEVECIVAERCRYGHLQYRVKWKDDPRLTWEFADDLAEGHCDDAVNDWKLRDVSTPPPAVHLHDSVEEDLVERPIAFVSTTTSVTESKMAAIELEISGLAWAMHRLQHYLEGAHKIIVITDHAPLPAVLKAPSHSQHHFTPRIEKLRAYLMPFLERMEFRYKPGKLHANVDALSRLPLASSSTAT
ncbi:uncharacterized protein UTRI_05171 [Ustilago trichophora]|uniref:RNA-directed DNA polymerase n=1 Tax=Ustilago trichophora TaxID=86804 RepID=A0A5C3EC80_9BASI|nr:uncharacterized protein UTRI_05171 [Ustilago trichophora]